MTSSMRDRPSRQKAKKGREAPSLKAEAHRQSLAAARSPHAKADQDFIDAISELNDLRAPEQK
jgi:hypothetical protein